MKSRAWRDHTFRLNCSFAEKRPFPMFSLSPVPYSSVHSTHVGNSANDRPEPSEWRADGRGRARSLAPYITAHARPVLRCSLSPSLCARPASQNGSIGISGIFLQAKLMMMMMMAELTAAQRCLQSAVAVRSDRVEKEGKDRCLQYRFFRSPFFLRPHYQARSRLWDGNCSVARASAKEC